VDLDDIKRTFMLKIDQKNYDDNENDGAVNVCKTEIIDP